MDSSPQQLLLSGRYASQQGQETPERSQFHHSTGVHSLFGTCQEIKV
jgi:hypothetical protein